MVLFRLILSGPSGHLPGFAVDRHRIWTSGGDSDLDVWCRFTVPSWVCIFEADSSGFCYLGYEDECIHGQQVCDYEAKLCKCTLPFIPVSGSHYSCQYTTPQITEVFPLLGPRNGGTLLTISGQNFVAGMHCCVNDINTCVPANIMDQDTITCTTPEWIGNGITVVDIFVVYNTDGSSPISNTIEFTYFGMHLIDQK